MDCKSSKCISEKINDNGNDENNLNNTDNSNNTIINTDYSNAINTSQISNNDEKSLSTEVDSLNSTKDLNKIKKIEKIVVPMKSRNAVLAGQCIASMIPVVNIITVPLLQPIEHHGLIIEVDNGYYYTHYGSNRTVSLDFNENKKEIIDEMINCCLHCDSRQYRCYEQKFPKDISIETIRKIVDELTNRFNANNYNAIKNNCQLYVKAVLNKIRGRNLPKNIYAAMLTL